MKLTEHFSYEEFIRSSKARIESIDNTPPDGYLITMVRTCEGLERVRSILGNPITVLSGYRCTALNKAVGGSNNSQHTKGEAADIICPAFGSTHDIAKEILANMKFIRFDQMIKEKNAEGNEWLHISFNLEPRYEVLTMGPSGLIIGLA
jgi:uncharacterized protein YcbK (DUF882 family)